MSYCDSHSFEFKELQQKVLGGQEEDVTTISQVFSALTSRLKWAGWCARNATHRPREHLHKPRTAAYVHTRLCLNEAYLFSHLAKVNRQLIGPAQQAKVARVVCS